MADDEVFNNTIIKQEIDDFQGKRLGYVSFVYILKIK